MTRQRREQVPRVCHLWLTLQHCDHTNQLRPRLRIIDQSARNLLLPECAVIVEFHPVPWAPYELEPSFSVEAHVPECVRRAVPRADFALEPCTGVGLLPVGQGDLVDHDPFRAPHRCVRDRIDDRHLEFAQPQRIVVAVVAFRCLSVGYDDRLMHSLLRRHFAPPPIRGYPPLLNRPLIRRLRIRRL